MAYNPKLRYIQASVGIAGGRQCYNNVADQMIVQDLIDSIPFAMGGRMGDMGGWAMPRAGYCAPDLHQAILRFQQMNRNLGLSVDGHIDPGGKGIMTLNAFAGGGSPTPNPSGPTGSQGIYIDQIFDSLRVYRTPWQIEDFYNGDVTTPWFALGMQDLLLRNRVSGQSAALQTFLGGVGKGAFPVGLSLSGMYGLRYGTYLYGFGPDKTELDVKRLTGQMVVVQGSLVGGPVGGNLSLAYFNPPCAASAFVYALLERNANFLYVMMKHSGAFAATIGQAVGMGHATLLGGFCRELQGP